MIYEWEEIECQEGRIRKDKQQAFDMFDYIMRLHKKKIREQGKIERGLCRKVGIIDDFI